MFKKLAYEVTFPATGRTFAQDLTFDAGFWAIVGPNESGKSLIFEMMRFSFFGTSALRGKADDYKTLTLSAEFTIKGVDYSITRTMRAAMLSRGGEVVASGVTAVNAKIVEILGFGITVFDMACSINQGEVERLGTLSPASRKQLVDSVLGIDALDVVAKWAMDEARLTDKEAQTIKSRLVCPTQPELPVPYTPTTTIDLPALRAASEELSQIEGFLSVSREKPMMPTCVVDLPAENLKTFATQRSALRHTVADLKAQIATLPESVPCNELQLNDAEAEWARLDLYEEAQRWLKANPQPRHNVVQLMVWRDDWDVRDLWEQWDRAQSQIVDMTSKIEAEHKISCPNCTHEFPLDTGTHAHQEAVITAALAVPQPAEPRPVVPPLSLAQIEQAIEARRSFDETKHNAMTAVEALDAPTISRAQIPVMRVQLSQIMTRVALMADLLRDEPKLAAMPDYEQMLVERSAYEASLPVYRSQLEAWETWSVERGAKQVRQQALSGARLALSEAEAVYAVSSVYEAAQARFVEGYETYVAAMADVDELDGKAAEYRKVRDVMNILRSLIKQHLMPSLNKVASSLLQQMTGGQRLAVVVDEDFNVVIDGQELETLSGSAKACANLSLRIALGQVLTNRVFSVLMADEIDASMDDFRAEQTANVLCTLENSISQVLLVSHKTIESVKQIDLGGQREPSNRSRAA